MQILAYILLLAHAFNAAATESAQSLEDMRKILTKYKQVEGTYKQIRKIKDMSLQLESSGDFTFVRPLELSLRQKRPFSMTLQMTEDELIQKNSGGREYRIKKSENPAIFTLGSSFLKIFAGDREALDKDFEYQATFHRGKWQLNLVPKNSLLKKAISQVKVAGGEFVESVQIVESSGNSSYLTFIQVKGR